MSRSDADSPCISRCATPAGNSSSSCTRSSGSKRSNSPVTSSSRRPSISSVRCPGSSLKREVVPENVADAVYVLTGPELSRTTGLHIPVDSGVAAAFLR